MAVKNFVLDTNILIHNPESVFKFEDNNVYITHTTMEELDNKKNTPGEVGFNARESIRIIEKLRTSGKLTDGVPTPGGGKLFLYTQEKLNYSRLPDGWDREKPDNKILLMALGLKSTARPNVILVTNDVSMRMKADILNLEAQGYRNDRISKEELYTGRADFQVSDTVIETFLKNERLAVNCITEKDTLVINQFVRLEGTEKSALGYFDGEFIQKLKYAKEKPFDVSPRNSGQIFAQEALMSSPEEVPLVILKGPAGTSKTFYSLACGLEQVVERGLYKRVLICRPNIKFDEDIGYLKGTEMDKIMPLIRPCLDNIEELISSNKNGKSKQSNEEIDDTVAEFFDRDWIRAEAMAYLRGRSITNTFIIIDEAQNTTANQMLGILTRAGHGSKICIIGDPDQIDSPRLDKYNNGLTIAGEKMKGSHLAMQLTFTEEECTRSELSVEAAKRLGDK